MGGKPRRRPGRSIELLATRDGVVRGHESGARLDLWRGEAPGRFRHYWVASPDSRFVGKIDIGTARNLGLSDLATDRVHRVRVTVELLGEEADHG
jgi:hypothetical protein